MPAEFSFGTLSVSTLGVDETIARLRTALTDEGWVVVFDHEPAIAGGAADTAHHILGVTNPALQTTARHFEAHIGLLLPLHLVVSVVDGVTIVAKGNVYEAFRLTNNGMLFSIATEMDQTLATIIATAVGCDGMGAATPARG